MFGREAYIEWSFRHRKKKLRAEQHAEAKKIKKLNSTADQMEARSTDWRMDMVMLDEELAEFDTNRLMRDAERFRIPTPPMNEPGVDWYRGTYFGAWALTQGAMQTLKQAIRLERRERFEMWTRWLPILSVLTGILGLVVAVLALLSRAR